jgi:pyridoxine kinase
LSDVFEGLETNGLANYTKILTGYVPGAEALEVVEKRIRAMLKRDPGIIYVLDRKFVRGHEITR